jgi:hypothetical protein
MEHNSQLNPQALAAKNNYYASLLQKPFDEVAVLLQQQSDEQIQGFVNYLFDLMDTQNGT